MKTFIECGCCGGQGSVTLGEVYEETLRGVRHLCVRQGRYVVANRDAAWFGCKPTALNNRLRRLEELGLVRCEVVGRQKRYTAL